MNVKRKIDWKKLIAALAINVGILVLLLIMFIPVEKTDDFSMKAILDGAFGAGISAHLLYCNFLLGSFLKVLQTLIPIIPWYEVANYLTIFISFTVITYIVFSVDNIKRSVLILLPILSFWGFEGYIKLTFTKTAGIAIACGLFIIFAGLKNNMKISYLIIGGLLVAAGSMFRYKMFYSVLPIMAGVIIIEFIIKLKNSEKSDFKSVLAKILRYLIPLVSVFIVVFSLNYVGTKLFRSNENWNHYKEYNSLKADLQDYGWPDYSEYWQEYNALGVSENDYNLWSDRDYGDPDILDNELLSEIVSLKNKTSLKTYVESIFGFFKEYPIGFIQTNVFCGALFLLILQLFSKKKMLKWLKVAYPLFMAMLLEYYMFCNGRYGKHHVEVCIWLAVAMFYVYFLNDESFSKYLYSAFGVLISVFILYSVKSDYKYMTTETYYGNNFTLTQQDARYILDIISEDKNNLYVLSNDEYYGLMRAYKTFESIPEGQLSNIFVLSAYNYPSHYAALEIYGYNNIYKNMTAPNVFYATSDGSGNAEMIKNYIKEHYNASVDYKFVYSIGKVNVYKFY